MTGGGGTAPGRTRRLVILGASSSPTELLQRACRCGHPYRLSDSGSVNEVTYALVCLVFLLLLAPRGGRRRPRPRPAGSLTAAAPQPLRGLQPRGASPRGARLTRLHGGAAAPRSQPGDHEARRGSRSFLRSLRSAFPLVAPRTPRTHSAPATALGFRWSWGWERRSSTNIYVELLHVGSVGGSD